MKPAVIVVAVLAAGACISAVADEADRPKEPPKLLLQKAVKASTTADGYHFRLRSQSATPMGGAGGQNAGIDGKGIHRKPGVTRIEDGNLGEIWMRGRKMLIKQRNEKEFKPPESLGPMGSIAARLIRTPSDIAEDMLRVAGASEFEGSEAVDELDCWVIRTVGDKDSVRKFIDLQLERMEGFGKMLGANQFDVEKAELTYRAWIGKEDGLIYRIENKAQIPTKANATPLFGAAPVNIDQTTTADYLLYNRDLDTPVPPEIKRKLGIK